MPKDFRMWLFQYILHEAGVVPKLIGPGKPFDTSVVNWNDEGKGHLIRVFGGKKSKYKTLLTDIPEKRPDTDDIVFPDDITLWKFPDGLFQKFMKSFKRSNKKRVETSRRYREAALNFSGEYLGLPCIQKVLEGLPEGQRNTGAHVVAIATRLDSMAREDAVKVMVSYAGNCPQENITENEYQGWIDWIFSQKNIFWNCRFCKELDVCEKACQFHESAFKKETDFLHNDDLLQNVVKVLGKKIKKDEKNRLLCFLVCLSAYGSNPLNLFLKGESSIGKTHLAKTVAEYFPEEDVWFIGDMSPKALIHEHGTFENGKMYISLQDKILVFMETPRRETLEMLKPILSHDRREIEYKITDKISGKLGTKRVIIEGWPATLFCTTDYKFLEELSTRSMLTTPETTTEKIEQVLKYKGAQYKRPWENKEDEQEKIFKGAVKLLKSDVGICIPYAEELAEKYDKNEPRVMRDYDKLMELIRMSAFLHQGQRLSFTVGGSRFIIANEYDFWVGKSLFESVRETTVTGIPQPVIDFYEKVIDAIDGVINYQSIRKQYVEVYKKPLSTTRLRVKFIEPLESIGWVTKDNDPIDKRKKIFEKCRLEENTGDIEDYEHSYFKGIFPEEKLKEFMDELEIIWNKNETCNTGIGKTVNDSDDNNWFYTEKVPYFLEDKNETDKGIINENSIENKNFTNVHNLGEKKKNCEVKKDELIDTYDEETVLSQIPEEDTKLEDVTKKFKNQGKVLNTIIILKEKKKILLGQGYKKILLGQGYIRRPGRSKK
jgi:hypothetical protein